VVPRRRDAQGRQQNPRRLSSWTHAGFPMGNGAPLLLRRAAFRGPAKLIARLILSTLFWLLRSGGLSLYPHFGPAQHLLQLGDLLSQPRVTVRAFRTAAERYDLAARAPSRGHGWVYRTSLRPVPSTRY